MEHILCWRPAIGERAAVRARSGYARPVSSMLRAYLGFAPALFALLFVTARAAANTCIEHAYERMAIELTEVRRDGEVVAKPPELGDLDEILNSGDQGRGVLLWNRKTMNPAKFYRLNEEVAAIPLVKRHIDAASARTLKTGCGYTVAYTPILPGRYGFKWEHSDGSKTSRAIDDPVVDVAPGRGTVALRFTLAGRAHQATYAVRCATFDWEDEERRDGRCAPSEPPGLARRPGAGRDDDAAGGPPGAISGSAGGCAGCTAAPAGGGGGGVLGAGLILLVLRRRRRTRPVSGESIAEVKARSCASRAALRFAPSRAPADRVSPSRAP